MTNENKMTFVPRLYQTQEPPEGAVRAVVMYLDDGSRVDGWEVLVDPICEHCEPEEFEGELLHSSACPNGGCTGGACSL